MLITKLKNREKLLKVFEEGRVFIFKCFGCKEVFFPENEINFFISENKKNVIDIVNIDYLCNETFASLYIKKNSEKICTSDKILVFSCGVGVQVVSKLIEEKIVLPGCDTFYLKGFQGISSQNVDCEQCGTCYLNITGGICPLTSCAKGLLNGPCGGANKDGKCEVNPEMDCGWVLIYNRLKKISDENLSIVSDVNIRDYSVISKKVRSCNEP